MNEHPIRPKPVVLLTLLVALFLLGGHALAQIAYDDTLYRNWTPDHLSAQAEIQATRAARDDRLALEAVIASGPLAGVTVRGLAAVPDDPTGSLISLIEGKSDDFRSVEGVEIVYRSDECGGMFIEVTFTGGPLAGSRVYSELSPESGYC